MRRNTQALSTMLIFFAALAAFILPAINSVRSAIARGRGQAGKAEAGRKAREKRAVYNSLMAWEGVLVEPFYQVVAEYDYADGKLVIVRDMTWQVLADVFDSYYVDVLEGQNPFSFGLTPYYNALQLAAEFAPFVFDEDYVQNAYQIWYAEKSYLPAATWAYRLNPATNVWEQRPNNWQGKQVWDAAVFPGYDRTFMRKQLGAA